MQKHFETSAIEQKWYQFWEDNQFFSPTANADASDYCIMLPPPNITGSLHMGHAFQDTLIDVLIRYHRMRGYNTLWQPGTDHAGIATQMVVERQLATEGKNRLLLGRDAFTDRIWQWKDTSGNSITQQLRRMGASPDWEHERFTMDDGLSAAVRQVFISLYDEGLIYRGKRLVNWDPVLKTAVSDLEVINKEEMGKLYHVHYPFVSPQANGKQHMQIATTRPETILADGALAVHPDDERYLPYVGQFVHVPMTDRTIPIIMDEYVDPAFGSGCVKITPAHDFNDFQVGQRHDMEVINLFTPDAIMNENAPEKYRGLDRFTARDVIVSDLQDAGLMQRIEDHMYKRPYGDRTGVVIEPYMTDQWFVKIDSLARPAIDAVRSGDIKFIPENWQNTYFNWMENIQDWCISRQLWWGHRIPAWYNERGDVFVGESVEAVRQKYQLSEDISLIQDNDVLDTWFSSALWPFSTLGWPENTDRLQQFYPTSVLVTGFDIIFFWVARMIMFGLKFTGSVPFKTVYIHGLVKDADGQKMSKSKGNVLDPIDLIDGIGIEDLVNKRTTGMMQSDKAREKEIVSKTRETYSDGIQALGTDTLRFTLMSLATTGRDIRFDLSRADGYKNYCNKLWNAARFVLMNVKGQNLMLDEAVELSIADHWIISRLQQVTQECNMHITNYRFDLMAEAIYSFTWHDYCDWYVEMSKTITQSDATDKQKAGTMQTLLQVLEHCLRLQHPIIPYITEEIWQTFKPLLHLEQPSICIAEYPQANEDKIDKSAMQQIAWLQEVVSSIRQIRSQMNISPSKTLEIYFKNAGPEEAMILELTQAQLRKLAKITSYRLLDDASDAVNASECAVGVVGDMQILIPMMDLIDKEQEMSRLNKNIEKLQKTVEGLAKKLENPNFLERAKPDIVTQEKAKHKDASDKLNQLQVQYNKIKLL